jgi:hypothetical protein
MSPLEKVTRIEQTKPWYGEFPTYYVYTLGIAGERFFREIKDSARIFGTRCQKCALVYVPPRIYCERCFDKLEEWVEVGTRGTVHTYTVAHVDLDGARLKEPVIIAFVALEGAHGGLIHQLGEVKPEEVKIGMPVRAVFKEKRQRSGSLSDIKYFKPV